uniref:Uncharacterized protein n=1 Tax=Hyaloperonospora arabidopsidis (strain Emoy2) TaxID=559515 RepID=M4C5B1_HYAAE
MFEVDDEDAADKQFGHFSTMTAVSFDDPNEEPYAEENSVANAYNVVAGQLVCCAMCALHKMQSDEQVFACWRAETVISRFTRRRDEGGDEKNITFDKRLISIQLKANSIDACESAASPHCELSPLKLRGSRAFENGEAVGIEHDGTPKDPFPGSPCTPCTPGDSTSVFSNASSVREIDHEMLDNRRLSSSLEDPHTAKVHVSQRPGFANIGWMPRRSMLNLVRNRLRTTKHCTDNI